MDSFNAVQSSIDAETAISIGANGTVTTGTLGGDHDVESWGSDLRSLAFGQISGLSSTMKQLADIGIDFNGTSSTLSIVNQTALTNALTNNSSDLAGFFGDNTGGFAQKFNTYLTKLLDPSTGGIAVQTNTINSQNSDISDQINTLNSRIADERTQLTNAFLAMQDAQSSAASQQQTINGMFSSSSSCWVARAVYGSSNPRWLLFRFWLLNRAPRWFRSLYLRHGERFATWIGDKPRLRSAIRHWMDSRVATLTG
jgi:flagellar hook-associated protein 2